MTSVVKKVIRRVRGTQKPQEQRDDSMDWLVAIRARQQQTRRWDRDKTNKRDDSFRKMLMAREVQVDAINAEKARQVEIGEARLKNLKKARRRLKRIRSTK